MGARNDCALGKPRRKIEMSSNTSEESWWWGGGRESDVGASGHRQQEHLLGRQGRVGWGHFMFHSEVTESYTEWARSSHFSLPKFSLIT